jgi:hypothetical protein
MLCVATVIAFLAVVAMRDSAIGYPQGQSDRPAAIVSSFLKATQARDLATAYSYISSADQGVQNKSSYVQSEVSLNGFALELARRLTAGMDVWVIEQKIGPTKAHLEIGYRVPTADELSPRLFDWNPAKLNRLLPAEQSALTEAVESLKKSQKKITLEGRETYDLVLQTDGWKIYFDWNSRARVNFTAPDSGSREVAVKFLRNNFLVKAEEPFQVDFRISNRTDRAVTTRLNHQFAPQRLANNIDMIACGLLAPLRLGPHETRDLSSSYLLRGKLPAQTRLVISYDFSSAVGPTK